MSDSVIDTAISRRCAMLEAHFTRRHAVERWRALLEHIESLIEGQRSLDSGAGRLRGVGAPNRMIVAEKHS